MGSAFGRLAPRWTFIRMTASPTNLEEWYASRKTVLTMARCGSAKANVTRSFSMRIPVLLGFVAVALSASGCGRTAARCLGDGVPSCDELTNDSSGALCMRAGCSWQPECSSCDGGCDLGEDCASRSACTGEPTPCDLYNEQECNERDWCLWDIGTKKSIFGLGRDTAPQSAPRSEVVPFQRTSWEGLASRVESDSDEEEERKRRSPPRHQ